MPRRPNFIRVGSMQRRLSYDPQEFRTQIMHHRSLHDGRADGLEPLESLSLENVASFADLLRAMSKTAFSGRELGQALDVLLGMSRDENCHVVLTLSGAMTVAKQGRIICDLIDRGIVDSVVTTGALMAHGLTESIGNNSGVQHAAV